MYIAYYLMRTDGDADLYAVVEDGEGTDEVITSALSKAIEQVLSHSVEEWFKVNHLECDFPDVWDLTSGENKENE